MNVIEGKRYRHLVKQTVYAVLHVASMESDGAPVVVYTEAGADKENDTIWVRPLGEFKQKFERVSS